MVALGSSNSSNFSNCKYVVFDLKGVDAMTADSFHGCDTIIHCAARLPDRKSTSNNNQGEFAEVNVEGTVKLAKLAATAGVKRFVFVSSIKVNGEETKSNEPFETESQTLPIDPYALSKYTAEKELMAIAVKTGIEVVVIRPPIVYGPKVKGNFALIVECVKKKIPLPLGSVENCRSFIAIENLVDFVVLCADIQRAPDAANEIFLISDTVDISTPQLIRKIAKAYGVKPRLIPCPTPLIKILSRILKKETTVKRLIGNLQIDCSKAQKILGWEPVITIDEQLKKMSIYDKSQVPL